jgi:T5orf172 domain
LAKWVGQDSDGNSLFTAITVSINNQGAGENPMSLSVVFVLSNPAMPGLVKIGKTQNEDAALRMAQLYTTGVPFPFDVEFVCRVSNPDEVERALHTAFAPNRVNPKREFFQIEAGQAIAILKLLHVTDDTKEFLAPNASIDASETQASAEFRKRRPNLNFEEMGIPIGSALTSNVTNNVVITSGPKKVRLDGEEMFLTAATRKILDLPYSVAPGPYWRF